MPVADVADLPQVFQRMRLSADQVGAGLDADEGDVFRAVLGDDRLQLGDVHVALERIFAGDLQALVDDDLLDRAAVDEICALVVVKW